MQPKLAAYTTLGGRGLAEEVRQGGVGGLVNASAKVVGRGFTFPTRRPIRRAQDGAPGALWLVEENAKATVLDAFVVGSPVDDVLLDGFHVEVLGQGFVGERWEFFV